MTENFGYDLPLDEVQTRRFQGSLNYWKGRNKFIKDMRAALSGNNPIEAPTSVQYKIRVIHGYVMATLLNEKLSRYLLRPVIQVIPEDGIDPEAMSKATRIEKAINLANYEIERKSDGDVWSRVIADAHMLDEGVEKWLLSPQHAWPELTKNDREVEAGGDYENKYPLGGESREAYKKRCGVPITKQYVPLEYFFPNYDGPNLVDSFEIAERTLISVLNNPLFRNEHGEEAFKNLPEPGPDGGYNQMVNIVEFVNNNCHAYYLAGPGQNARKWPKVEPWTHTFNGELKLLYKYEHETGRSLYNCVGGRFGGWKTSTNKIEGIGKGLLELSQAIDDILSQIYTNVRAKYWPSLNFVLDPEKRGYGPGTGKPDAPVVKEGEPLVTFVGEQILPIFEPKDDPMTMWLYDQIQGQISKMGGSSVLFGEKSPGVDTGYHQALQQTAAESLDEKLEQHINMGATQGALILMLLAKSIGEKVWMHYTEPNPREKKRKVGKYVFLDPEDLTPIPQLDAQVRKQRPVDFLSALRAAREASDDRGGKGPLMSDARIRQSILTLDAPDEEEAAILVESQKRELLASGVFSAKIGDLVNIKLAKHGVPEMSPELMQKADPALIQAIQSTQGQAAQAGGVDPNVLAGAAETMGLPPGPLPGDAEPENRLGEAIVNAQTTGAAI